MTRHVHLVKELQVDRASSLGSGSGSGSGISVNTIVVDSLNAVPGFKTSAAFFSFLRQNLVLPVSALNSSTSTPLLDPSSSQTLPPLYASCLANMSSADSEAPLSNPLADIPPLVTTTLTSEADKVAALKLVADSIAQQRQAASQAIIFHPLIIAAWVGLMGITSHYMYKEPSDIGILLTTIAGITMTLLVAVRGATGAYLTFAEELNWNFIKNEDGEEDIIIGSRYGDELIAATILRLERNGHGSSKKKAKGGKGIVRAWTTRIRYRHTGVGTEMLEEAIKVTRQQLGNSAEIGFAAEHANSRMVLPEMFNGVFRKREARAARALEGVIAESKKR